MHKDIDLYPKVCNLCGGEVEFVPTGKVYGTYYLRFGGSGFCYHCKECGAIVTTHKNDPKKAKGILANKEMAIMRQKTHALFDKFWRNKTERGIMYKKLADELGIEESDCHFGYMNLDELNKAHEILLKWWREKYDI